jgi:hypothetical protein
VEETFVDVYVYGTGQVRVRSEVGSEEASNFELQSTHDTINEGGSDEIVNFRVNSEEEEAFKTSTLDE